jgi:hypothetical protein
LRLPPFSLLLLAASLAPAGEPAQKPFDERADFEASAFAGLSIDSFAASDLNRYVNPEVSGKLKERAVAGIDFAYRLYGDPSAPRGHQLWVYGETIHGMRSADVDCTANPSVPTCKDALKLGTLKPGESFLYMLRNATSLEAFAGLRWEFATLRPNGGHPARAYVNAQFGFVSVAGSGNDVMDLHHLGLGLTAVNGRFSGSRLEAGYGKSDFFHQRRNNRLKVDGYLTWKPGWKSLDAIGLRPFIQMTVDSDYGPRSDSIQTYIGLNFDLDHMFGHEASKP